MLSRNFRLQRVGDIQWLQKNYNFSHIATSIDELIILDISRESVDTLQFCSDVEGVVAGCFMPLALGGGVRTEEQVRTLMESGADKIVLNSALYKDKQFVQEIVRKYGSQSIIASIDYKKKDGGFCVFTANGNEKIANNLSDVIRDVIELGIGEIYLNSMDQDGTGQGYCMSVFDALDNDIHVPIIMAGGAGNAVHFESGLEHSQIDAVATANLFNFIGDGLPKARLQLLNSHLPLAQW